MNINFYHVDAFTAQQFKGNPAAVCFLPQWLATEKLQMIAIENALPASAFVVKENQDYSIRWFTPDSELDLCGHGTIATAFIIFNYLAPEKQEISFQSPAGLLKVFRNGQLLRLTLPVKKPEKIAPIAILDQALGKRPDEVYQFQNERLLAVFANETDILNMQPDVLKLKQLNYRGFVVTAPSSSVDFVSRTFYPRKIQTEDAVTGASHCLLVPYWSMRLQKQTLVARQVSARGGEIECEYLDDLVALSSRAVLYARGIIELGD